jgi:hypothetical protein
MTDELTPEEKEAIARLPRERMPAGLETRVVDAMREHRFLPRRRRTIELTTGRVAGLLAASIAVMIGAYSIGLHRGDGSRILPAAEAPAPGTLGRLDEPTTALEREVEPAAPADALEKDAASTDEARQNVAGRAEEPKREVAAQSLPAAPAASDEATADRPADSGARKRTAAMEGSDVAESARAQAPAPAAAMNESVARLEQYSAAPGVSKAPLTFLLDGTPVIVEAPDSVRVTEDERGRMLIIYTSDGIIRIRLADER